MTKKCAPVDVTEPLNEMLRGLDFAFGHHTDGPPSLELERERYATALAAIGRFLMKIGRPQADRFFELGDALTDLNIGARPQILRGPRRKSSPNSTQIEAAKAWVAFALEAFIRLGEKPRQAAKMLLASFPGIKKLAGKKSHRQDYSWEQTILEWRKTLSSRSRKKNEHAAEIFSVGCDLITFLIKEKRPNELKARALNRAKFASRVVYS
ncbi:MAG TPA: hypothetical protein VGF53_02500 [Pseudolabrys sp.]